jgi:hypothetical protein
LKSPPHGAAPTGTAKNRVQNRMPSDRNSMPFLHCSFSRSSHENRRAKPVKAIVLWPACHVSTDLTQGNEKRTSERRVHLPAASSALGQRWRCRSAEPCPESHQLQMRRDKVRHSGFGPQAEERMGAATGVDALNVCSQRSQLI